MDGVQTPRHPAVRVERVEVVAASQGRVAGYNFVAPDLLSSDLSIYFQFTCMNADALPALMVSSCVFIAV